MGNQIEVMNQQMLMLLKKYARGKIPPLIVEESPELGLVNGEMLRIYQRGFSGAFSIPLGILIAAREYSSLEEKWMNGDYHLNEWARSEWTSTCRTIRLTKEGNAACERCDRRRAIMAEKKREVIAYLCDPGLLDFAVPVSVGDEVIAVLFTGQRKPKEGAIWNSDIINLDGVFKPLAPGDAGVDAWAECERRLHGVEERMGYVEGRLLEFVDNDAKERKTEISPEQVGEMIEVLRKAGEQLSVLATSKYELEKDKVGAWIRSNIAHSLTTLSAENTSTARVWENLSKSLEYIITCFGLDYIMIMLCNQQDEGSLILLCQSGLQEDSFHLGEYKCTKDDGLSKFISEIIKSDEGSEINEISEINLSRYAKLPIMDKLRKLHAQHKTYTVLAVPILTHKYIFAANPSIMILGNWDKNLSYNSFNEYDKEDLLSIIQSIRLMSEIVMLVDHLEEVAESQHIFVEAVAHDIRNPIQNIIAKADLLRKGLFEPKDVPNQVQRLAAQARRVHLLSQRVWTLEALRRKDFKPDEVNVNVYQVIMECQQLLMDLVESKGLKMSVDKELQNLPTVKLDRNLFMQTMLNLMDNAIKYSTEGEIRVDGRYTTDGIAISVVNRGIQIRDGDKRRIFERYVRTDEARLFSSSGTGIGLAVVKAFADIYGGGSKVDVRCNPISGTDDYVTEFVLPIKVAEF